MLGLCDSAGAATAFVRAVILIKEYLENRSSTVAVKRVCVRITLTNDWKGESDSSFSSTNRSKPRTNETKIGLFFSFAKTANPITL